MRNKERKCIAKKKEDKENKQASVKKIEDTRKLKKYRDRRIGPVGIK